MHDDYGHGQCSESFHYLVHNTGEGKQNHYHNPATLTPLRAEDITTLKSLQGGMRGFYAQQ